MTGIVNCECSDGDGHGIAPNVCGLGEVGDLEAQSLKLLLMLIKNTNDE